MKCPHCGEETVPHGTNYHYNVLGCRCDICRANRADEQREYRERQRRKQESRLKRLVDSKGKSKCLPVDGEGK